jgi:tetratricopeptide (TPR) repeat protein
MTIQEILDNAAAHWDNPAILTDMGCELEARSRFSQARRILERAIGLAPLECGARAYVALAFVHFRDVESSPEKGEMVFTNAIESTNWDVLKAWYVAFLEDEATREYLINTLAQSNDPAILFTLGHALLWRGEAQDAFQLITHAMAMLGPDPAPEQITDEAELYCATHIWLQGKIPGANIEQAMKVLDILLQRYPRRYFLHSLKVTALQAAKKWQDVIAAAQHILGIFPDEETTMLALGMAYEKTGNIPFAQHWLARAIGAKPSFVRARMVAARIAENNGQDELAEELMLQIPMANPAYAVGKCELAYFLFKKGKTDQALHYYQQGYNQLKTYEKSIVNAHPVAQQLEALKKEKNLLVIL